MKKTILLICTTLALLSMGCQKDKMINKIVVYNPNGGVGTEVAQEIRRSGFWLEDYDYLGYYYEGYEFLGWGTEDGQLLQPNVNYYDDVYRTLQDISTLNAIWGKGILMRNGSYSLSDGESIVFYDSGGSGYNYQNNENYNFHFYAPPGKHLSVIFYNLDLESGLDKLTINGISNITTNYLYVTPDNYLNTTFKSDYSVTYSGWRALISVVD